MSKTRTISIPFSGVIDLKVEGLVNLVVDVFNEVFFALPSPKEGKCWRDLYDAAEDDLFLKMLSDDQLAEIAKSVTEIYSYHYDVSTAINFLTYGDFPSGRSRPGVNDDMLKLCCAYLPMIEMAVSIAPFSEPNEPDTGSV